MSTHADIPVENGVAHVALNAGTSGRLTVPVLQQIADALSALEKDTTTEIVILTGSGASFPSGLTNPEAGGDDRNNLLSHICTRLENFPKPVIAVLTGAVIGGGAELALACHYRLAHKDARIGFPNARLGLVPNAGATQRLPRLAGAEVTLDLLLDGHLLPFGTRKTEPLADQVFDGGRYEAILAFTEFLRSKGTKPRPTATLRKGFADPQAYQAAVTNARQRLDPKNDIAATHIVSAVEAALLLPIDAGLAFEEAAFEDCSQTLQARGLTHVFHAEQTVSAHTRRGDLPQISTIAILGPGALASQIAMSALDAGLQVNWIIKDPTMQRDAIAHVRGLLQDAVMKGKISADRAQLCQEALHHGEGADMLVGADIVLRAARGQRGISVPPGIPLAHCLTGTDPRLAMRFAPVSSGTRLVEVVLGPDGSDDDLRIALGLARRLNTLAVVERTSGDCLHDRLVHAMWRAADALVDLGQSPFTIDTAMRTWGMALPPYELADFVGLDLVAREPRAETSQNWSGELARMGRNGRAKGQGFYAYPKDAAATPDPAILAYINHQRPARADLPQHRIVRLLIGAMANEGARPLRESVIPDASDVDVVSIFTGLLPRWSGGILHYASVNGLLQITKAMTELGHPDAAFWTPDPVFADMIKHGRSFDDR
jgi:3-hydroxyacyl-CoA dehydrogenase